MSGTTAHGGDGTAQSPGDPLESDARHEIERGFRFAHIAMMTHQARGNQLIVDDIALAELLMEKGIFSAEEFEAARERARKQVEELPQPRIRLLDLGDKYADEEGVEIDCASRIHLCQARCCTFQFFLTAQDLDEGVARWDYGNPYWIRQRADGYCVHCDPSSRACTIHAQRPHVCRLFDCRQDKRIWIDFEKRIPAPFTDPPPAKPIAMAQPDLARPYGPKPEEPAADGTDSANGA